MYQHLVNAVMGFIGQYGYLALFVYMALETSFVLHYVPSEIVVPFAASQLVHGPVSFVLFVTDATAGATAGSVIAYVLFGRYGRAILERHGHLVHVSRSDLDRAVSFFDRYGRSSVFWGRLVPFLRAFVSIPAGMDAMDMRRFVVYSTAGAALFNTILTYLVYTGADRATPTGMVVGMASTYVGHEVGYVQHHPRFVLVLVGTAVLVGAVVWLARGWLRTNPDFAMTISLNAVRVVGIAVGAALILGGLTDPTQAYPAVTALWNDPKFWVKLGLSPQVALVVQGVVVAGIGWGVHRAGSRLDPSDLHDAARRLGEYIPLR